MARMKRTTIITALVLTAVIVGIIVALFMEASAGPTFRAEDYGSVQECMRNIPPEWGPGSLQRDGAEQACMYVHARNR